MSPIQADHRDLPAESSDQDDLVARAAEEG